MQRNEVDASLSSTQLLGLGTPELWQRLGLELDGKTQLDKPRVSKKVLVKALRMQTEAMKFLVDEFEQLRDKMGELERETKGTQKHVERVGGKLLAVQGQVEDVALRVHEVAAQQDKHGEQLRQIDEVAAQTRATREELRACLQRVEEANAAHEALVAATASQVEALQGEQELTKQFAMKLEDRMNTEEKELFLDSDHILHQQLSLAMWIEASERDNRRKDEALRECGDKMARQSRNVHDMMLETRRTLDDNTCAVEDVQRLLLDKADRARVDEAIEAKYEEICHQVDKALAAVLGEEDEFKRVSQELQQLVTFLGETKADRRELLEVKEQVLYDSRVRQQVENLRAFIDLKMNRDDVFAALKNKADKEEMLALLKSLSDGMSASVLHAQRSLQEPEAALLSGKHLGSAGNNGSSTSSSAQKRGGTVLPSIERERCLSCNSTIRDANASAPGPVTNKSPFQMTPVYGGGFQLPGSTSVDKTSSQRASNSTGGSRSVVSPRTPLRAGPGPLQPGNARSSLSESASEGFLLGVDGHVYQGDPELIAQQLQERSASSTLLPPATSLSMSRANPAHKLSQAIASQRRATASQDSSLGDDTDSGR